MPVRPSRSLPGLLVHNLGAKFISLVLALIAWYMIQDVISHERTIPEVPIDVLVEEGWAILDRSESVATVTLRGPEEILYTLDRDRVKVTVDIRGEQMLDVMFLELTPDQVEAPRGIKPVKVEADPLFISLDREGQREVPVVANIQGQLPEGFELESATCRPSSVVLYGPRKRLDEIKTVGTEPIDLVGRIRSFDQTKRVVSPSENWVARVEPETVTVEVIITERSSSRKFETVEIKTLVSTELPVQVALAENEATVILVGREDVLQALTKREIQAYVDCDRLDLPMTGNVPVRVHAPTGTRVSNVLPSEILISVSPAGGPPPELPSPAETNVAAQVDPDA